MGEELPQGKHRFGLIDKNEVSIEKGRNGNLIWIVAGLYVSHVHAEIWPEETSSWTIIFEINKQGGWDDEARKQEPGISHIWH